MHPRTKSNSLRHSPGSAAVVTALERRLNELEDLTTSQQREIRIQFERIAQRQAEWDVLWIRFIKARARHGKRRGNRPMDD